MERQFGFGDKYAFIEHDWFAQTGDFEIQPDGLEPPNACGLCDTLGNVQKWCSDMEYEDSLGRPQSVIPWVGLSSTTFKRVKRVGPGILEWVEDGRTG